MNKIESILENQKPEKRKAIENEAAYLILLLDLQDINTLLQEAGIKIKMEQICLGYPGKEQCTPYSEPDYDVVYRYSYEGITGRKYSDRDMCAEAALIHAYKTVDEIKAALGGLFTFDMVHDITVFCPLEVVEAFAELEQDIHEVKTLATDLAIAAQFKERKEEIIVTEAIYNDALMLITR